MTPDALSATEAKADFAKRRRGTRVNRRGWVYLLQVVNGGPCKIGITFDYDPFRRIRTIDQGLPYAIAPLAFAYVEDALGVEAQLHNRFEHLRLRREWFTLDADDIQWLLDQPEFGKPAEMIHKVHHEGHRATAALLERASQ